MERFNASSSRAIAVFVAVLIAVLVLMQAHLTHAQPSQPHATLKTIANIVVHAHRHHAHPLTRGQN